MSKQTKRPKHRLTFTDVESTGLCGDQPSIDEALRANRQIIEYAFVVWEDGNIVKTFEKKVMPTGDALKDAEECAANGWNHFDKAKWWAPNAPGEYSPAKPWGEADCEVVSDFTTDATMAGSNPAFDQVLYRAEFFRLVKAYPKASTHRMMDTGALAWPLIAAGLIEKSGLEHLAKFLGVEHKQHTAMGDVRACIGVYEILCERFIHSPRKLRDLVLAIVPGLQPKSDQKDAAELLAAVKIL